MQDHTIMKCHTIYIKFVFVHIYILDIVIVTINIISVFHNIKYCMATRMLVHRSVDITYLTYAEGMRGALML